MTMLFLLGLLASGFANFVCSILILRALNEAGTPVSFYEMRWQVHKHLKTYKQVTVAANGKIGLPFYGYWGSLVGLLMSGVLLWFSLSP